MPKADIGKRIIAWIIDQIIIGVILGLFIGLAFLFAIIFAPLAIVFYLLGILIVLIYWLLKDGLMNGRSIGKKVMSLKVINIERKTPCSFLESFLRNILWYIPIISFIELILPIIDADGIRLGDRLAKTQVVEG